MRPQKTKIFLLLLSFALFHGCKMTKESSESPRPNFLFIAVDDLRPELANYGARHISSPSIDKLASESLVFDRAYCNIPVCGASRASLLSGKRPGRHRFIGFSTRLDVDYPGIISMPKHFKNHGYSTVSNGKIYHHVDDDAEAWDEVWRPKSAYSPRDYLLEKNIVLDNKEGSRGYPYEKADVADNAYKDGKTLEKSLEDLRNFKESGKPFFLAVGLLKPHLPFNAPSKYWEIYDSTKITLPANYLQPESIPKEAYHNFGELRSYASVPKEGPVSDELANKLIHGYYACVSYTDAQIGRLLDELKNLELDKNTIVVFWGDHGWNLGNHMLWCKHCNFESSLHVPMMIKVPGKTSGQRTADITEFIDIYPTLSELAGLPLPDHLDGESLVGSIEGKVRPDDYAISKFHDGVTIIKGDYFYTEYLGKDDEPIARMMFDHSTDPLELENLAELEEYQSTVEQMHKLMRADWGDDFFENRKAVSEPAK